MRQISIEEFDARFDELMELVDAGQSFAIAREGKSVAILRRIEEQAEGEAASDA